MSEATLIVGLQATGTAALWSRAPSIPLRRNDDMHPEPNISWSALERTDGFVMHYSDGMNLKGSIVQLLT